MSLKKTIQICKNSISKYSIVLPSDASPTEVTAATELAAHIYSASGETLPVCRKPSEYNIFIGNAAKGDRSGIKYDGFVISTDDQNLYLYGAIDRGTLYAVYRFLEKYVGFRKYAIGVERLLDGDCDIPSGLMFASNPAFELRRTDWIGHTSDTAFAAWEGMNTGYFKDIEQYGGHIKNIGGCHTFERLCDPKIYFEEHPEYYSLYNGKRIPAGNVFDRECGQLCLTNPDVLNIVIANVKKWLSENPDADIVEISQNDNTRYCQCEKCAAVDAEEGSPSGLLLRFVNAVADAIADEYPKVLVQTFAYQYTRKAPKITKPHKNVIIRYCTIEACFRHALSDASCEQNAGKFADELSEWRNICDKISIWDYTTNYSCYLAPFPNFEILRENVRFFADNHAIHVFEEDTPGTYTGDLGDLKAYVLARLLWNPYMSAEEYEAYICDFLEGYYGAGWRNIRKYMHMLDDATRDKHMGCFERMDNAFLGSDPLSESYIPQAYQDIYKGSYLRDFIPQLDEAIALWDEAEALASDDAERERIRRSKLSLTYLDLFCRPHDKDKMTDAEKKEYEKAVSKYYADKKRFGIQTNIWTQRAGH
jgi:hypothetical protein